VDGTPVLHRDEIEAQWRAEQAARQEAERREAAERAARLEAERKLAELEAKLARLSGENAPDPHRT
jgi:hypothetical protein